MELQNSKIRKIILGEHEGLRHALQTMEAGLEKVAKGDVEAQKALHGQLTRLLDTFLRHIEHEERILRPVLKDIDAWGPERLAHMDKEHAGQRVLVTHLAGLFPSATPDQWVTEVRAFVTHLREDMEGEEKDCLDPRLLRDDVISLDTFGG